MCGTVDKFIWRLLPDADCFQPDQILINEAAYTSLAKVLPFLAVGIPIALLGDQKQLPPVCGMAQTISGFTAWKMRRPVCGQHLRIIWTQHFRVTPLWTLRRAALVGRRCRGQVTFLSFG